MNEVSTIEAITDSKALLVEGDAFKNAYERVPQEYWAMNEERLREIAKPTRSDYALRSSLWHCFRQAELLGEQVKPLRIYSGICSYTNWYVNVLSNPAKVAWLLQPLQSYEKSLEPLLGRIVERLHEFLNLDVYDRRGRPIPTLVKAVINVMVLVENRLKGAATQRVESKNLNLQMQSSSNVPKETRTIEDIDKEIESAYTDIFSNLSLSEKEERIVRLQNKISSYSHQSSEE